MTTKIRVRITKKDHPHFGETGELTGKVVKIPWGTEMAEVKLDDCPEMVGACFVRKCDVVQI